jgi:hypothetical protein
VQGLQACRDSLSRLESQSHIPNVTVAALTQWIHEHVHQCKAPLEALDGE